MLYFLAVLVFLLIACSKPSNQIGVRPAGPPPNYLSSCKEFIQDSGKYGNCTRQLLSNASYCFAVTDKYEREDCFSGSAIALENFSLCGNIEHGNNVDYERYSYDLKYLNCYLGVAAKLAIENKNSSYCDITLTKRDKDDCLWGLFILTKNPQVCNQITDNILKTECLSSAKT